MKFRVDLEMGPVLRTALDVLDLAQNILDTLPERPESRKQELQSRCLALYHFCHTMLESQAKKIDKSET